MLKREEFLKSIQIQVTQHYEYARKAELDLVEANHYKARFEAYGFAAHLINHPNVFTIDEIEDRLHEERDKFNRIVLTVDGDEIDYFLTGIHKAKANAFGEVLCFFYDYWHVEMEEEK